MPDESDIFHPGNLVCLRNDRGDLIAAKLGARGTFELSAQTHRSRFRSIPPESIFVILRRGNHIGFQCLGAEGRFIQACEDPGSPHSLAQGFGSREAWEVTSPDASRIVNAHYRFKELGARVQLITALRTIDLVHFEEDLELRANHAYAKLQSLEVTVAENECRAEELIKAGQRATSESQRQLQEIRSKLDSANRMALHWQEQATLANEALQEAETALQKASTNQATGRPSSASINDDSNEIIQELKAQIAALRLEHAGQIRDLETRYSAALEHSRPQPLIDAVRAEAAAALEAMEAAHASEIQRLLEERARLDSALKYIKDMCCPLTNTQTNAEQERDHEDDEVANQHLDRSTPPIHQDHTAVGIPVEPSTVIPITAFGSLASEDFFKTTSSTSSGGAIFLSPAPADYAVFDAAGKRSKIDEMYEMVNALRPSSGASTVSTAVIQTNKNETHEVFQFDDPFGSPESRNRVVLANGGCGMVDYNGLNPDVITEESMRRVLENNDGQNSNADDKEVSYLVERLLPTQSSSVMAVMNTTGRCKQNRHRDPETPIHSTAHNNIKSRTNINKNPSSSPASGISDGGQQRHGRAITSKWADTPLSLPASRSPSLSPAKSKKEDEEHVYGMAPTAAVLALDESSPAMANYLAQYLATDHQVSVRASLPTSGLGAGSNKLRAVHLSKNDKENIGITKDKISALRHSAPTGSLRRSSFLQRPLVTERDLFGGANSALKF